MDKNRLFKICLFSGFFGGHYFAIGKFKKGLLYFFTVGLFFFGWLYDLFRIATSDNFLGAVENQERVKFEQKQAEQIKVKTQREKLKEYREEGVPYCPRCRSTHLTAQKKGFSLGKGLAGSAIVLPLGAVTGMIGKNKIYLTCLNCGHRFKPGKRF